MKAMMDQLMGKDRDLDPSQRRVRKWDDEDVCPYFLCGMCPHDLFSNTKSDLGSCPKDHEPKLAEELKKESERIQIRTERRYLRHLQDLIRVVDNRVKRGEERLNLTSDLPNAGPYAAELSKKNDSIRSLQTEMETLGEEGKMDEVNELMAKLEDLKREKEVIELKNNQGQQDQQSAMKMCEICGIWKSENPEDARAKNHFIGKQHVGYGKIRDSIKILEEKHAEFEKKPKPTEEKGEEKNGENDKGDRRRDREGDKDRSERRPDRSERRRSRSPRKDRDSYRDRDKGQDRPRDRDRDRSRSDRDRSSRDHDRDRRRR